MSGQLRHDLIKRNFNREDDMLIKPISDAIGGLIEAKRLLNLHAKGSQANMQRAKQEVAEQLFLTLNYLDLEPDELHELMKEEEENWI